MSAWNGLDFLIFLIFFANMVLGMNRGATKEIVSLMCLSVALIFTIKFTIPMQNIIMSSPLLQDVLTSETIQNFMGAIGADPLTADYVRELAFTLSVLIWFTGAFCISEAMSVSGFVETFSFPWAVWNRKVGGAIGCTRGFVFVVILIMLCVGHVFKDSRHVGSLFSGSYFVRLFTPASQRLDELIQGQEIEQYNEIYEYRNLYTPSDIEKTLGPQPQYEPPPDTTGYPSGTVPPSSTGYPSATQPPSSTGAGH